MIRSSEVVCVGLANKGSLYDCWTMVREGKGKPGSNDVMGWRISESGVKMVPSFRKVLCERGEGSFEEPSRWAELILERGESFAKKISKVRERDGTQRTVKIPRRKHVFASFA